MKMTRSRTRRGGALALLGLALCTPGIVSAQSGRAKYVIVVGVDGLAPEGIRQSQSKHLGEMMRRAAWTFRARAVIPTVSSPNWASMIMGAGPAQHGVTSNEWQPEKHDVSPVCQGASGTFPTVFELMRQQKPSAKIGIFHHWQDYGRLVGKSAKPDRLEHHKEASDTMKAAIAWWTEQKPELLFVHLDNVDHAGHDHGCYSAEYRKAVEEADRLIGQLVAAVRAAGAGADTFMLVTADHGGKEKKHGGLSLDELEIPWIAAGPGISKGEVRVPVNTYDTAATLAFVLGIKPHDCWIARPIKEAWVDAEPSK
jgi:predicted AlkP superfamily pyrophosphatase or phosphodiesterase